MKHTGTSAASADTKRRWKSCARCLCTASAAKSFSYKTNLTAERVTHTCLACKSTGGFGAEQQKTAYVTVGERR